MSNFCGKREEWLKMLVYLQTDFTADDFTTNLGYVTINEKIKMGYDIKEPQFIEHPNIDDEGFI